MPISNLRAEAPPCGPDGNLIETSPLIRQQYRWSARTPTPATIRTSACVTRHNDARRRRRPARRPDRNPSCPRQNHHAQRPSPKDPRPPPQPRPRRLHGLRHVVSDQQAGDFADGRDIAVMPMVAQRSERRVRGFHLAPRGAVRERWTCCSQPSVASGLQRVGRAGHQVGAVSRGVFFPKYRDDLVVTSA